MGHSSSGGVRLSDGTLPVRTQALWTCKVCSKQHGRAVGWPCKAQEPAQPGGGGTAEHPHMSAGTLI